MVEHIASPTLIDVRKNEARQTETGRQEKQRKSKTDKKKETKEKGFVQISSDPENQRLETETTSALTLLVSVGGYIDGSSSS